MTDGSRIATLIGKELREFRANPSAMLPVVLVIAVCLLLPLGLLVVMPRATGQSLADDELLRKAVAFATSRMPEIARLPAGAAAEAFLFQQFLLLFLMVPIMGAVSLAAYSVVGEKQGRTLEPLLTTPLTTAELLVGKVLAAFLPSLLIEIAGLAIYLLLLGLFAAPGVLEAVLSARSLLLVAAVGPLATLTALQATIAVSSRVNDPRSAQQVAVLIVLPLAGVLLGQILGAFVLTTGALALGAAALGLVWMLLVMLSVALFDRETILTRWK